MIDSIKPELERKIFEPKFFEHGVKVIVDLKLNKYLNK
jgi:hypothetical protein